jgi:hypothetical protein
MTENSEEDIAIVKVVVGTDVEMPFDNDAANALMHKTWEEINLALQLLDQASDQIGKVGTYFLSTPNRDPLGDAYARNVDMLLGSVCMVRDGLRASMGRFSTLQKLSHELFPEEEAEEVVEEGRTRQNDG